MAAYFLTEITVHHPKKMGEYASKVGATIAKHEGVLLSMEKAKGCYNSPEYKEILDNRLEKTLQYL